MLVGDPHATTIQSIEDGVGQTRPERSLDVVLSQHVHRASDGEVREAFGADPNGLALVDEGDRAPVDGAGDGCGFTVIESLGCRPADKAREMGHAPATESGTLDEMLLYEHG